MEQRALDAAEIASSVAAAIYGGTILKRSSEDDRSKFSASFCCIRRRKHGL
jgi:hypothetical protein